MPEELELKHVNVNNFYSEPAMQRANLNCQQQQMTLTNECPPTLNMDQAAANQSQGYVVKRGRKPLVIKSQFGSRRKIVNCSHTERPYYAKGMCVNCYHRKGRTKMAWTCPHRNRTHYSKGLCKYCYLSNYYKNRNEQRTGVPETQNNDFIEISDDSLDGFQDQKMQ